MDDVTRQAAGLLFFKHMDRISSLICDPTYDDLLMHVPVVHAETLLAFHLDNDEKYQEEMRAIEEEYKANPPRGTHPDTWKREQRQMELRAAFKAACRDGVFSQVELERVEDVL